MRRTPFLMIDRVLECEPGQRVVAVKCVSVNEPQFQGHFPGQPIFPGVLPPRILMGLNMQYSQRNSEIFVLLVQ